MNYGLFCSEDFKDYKKRFFVEILCLTGKSWRKLTINPTRFSFYPNVDRAASGQKCPFDGYKRKRERRTLSSPKQPSKGDVFPRPRRRRRRRLARMTNDIVVGRRRRRSEEDEDEGEEGEGEETSEVGGGGGGEEKDEE